MGSTAQLKSGPAFPFENSIKGTLGPKTRENSIKSSIRMILTTPRGSVPYNPELGSMIPRLVFDPLDDSTLNLIFYYAINDLEQDPRVKVTSISIDTEPSKVIVQVGYIDNDDVQERQHQSPVVFQRT